MPVADPTAGIHDAPVTVYLSILEPRLLAAPAPPHNHCGSGGTLHRARSAKARKILREAQILTSQPTVPAVVDHTATVARTASWPLQQRGHFRSRSTAPPNNSTKSKVSALLQHEE